MNLHAGYQFNTVVVDCEGCIQHVLADSFLARIDLLVIEQDARVDYLKWHRKLGERA